VTPVKSKTRFHHIGVTRWLALVSAVGITLVGGALHGHYVQRWNKPEELSAAAAQLDALPREIGKWKAVEDLPIDAAALNILDHPGRVSRRYVNQDTGQSIQCAILVGRPGPIAVHTPEICFSSRDYEIQNERIEAAIDDRANHHHTFWRTDFSSRNALADGLRVYYAWSTGSIWKASTSPRFEFGGAPLLFKCQLATYVSPSHAQNGPDPGHQFLEMFVTSAWPPPNIEKRE
jgi:hypothetical protein